jgi:hypothetical protein
MSTYHLTNNEIALRLAKAIRAWRASSEGASLTQADLAQQSGVSLTSISRFEQTGAITLHNFVAILRTLDLLDGLETLVPNASDPGPLAILELERKQKTKTRARKKGAQS